MPDPIQTFLQTFSSRREVRAIALSHPLTTPLEQRFQKPQLLSFERRLDAPLEEETPELCILRFPFESLERWRDWDALEREAPLHLMFRLEPLYDPAEGLKRVAKVFGALEPKTLRKHASLQLKAARRQLEDWQKRASRPDHRSSEQILALVRARTLLRTHLYPALLSRRGVWFGSQWGYPELLRDLALLEAPRAVYALDELYGFDGEAEARKLIPATRGLGLSGAEREAKRALEGAYFDGAVMFLRDETAKRRAEDLSGWTHLSPSRQERLSVLLGLERAPLGLVALATVERVLLEVERVVGLWATS